MERNTQDKQGRTPRWHPLSMIPFFLKLSADMLDSSKEQILNMALAKKKPHVLSDNEIERSLKLYTEMNEDIWVFLEQCERWLKMSITKKQKEEILKIKKITLERERINKDLLKIVKELEPHTINKMMAMDPKELALKMLSGQIPSPF